MLEAVYECPTCGHRVMVEQTHSNTAGPVYCGCGSFEVMDCVRMDGHKEEKDHVDG